MAKRHKNPSNVEDMSRDWHGRGSQNETDIEEVESYEEDLAELADLEELGVLASNLKDEWNICFKSNRPKLACDAKGHNLEIIGGDQYLEVEGFREASRNGKKVVPLGWLVRIVYETDKHHLEDSNGSPESYEHYFGEDYYQKKFAEIDDYDTPDEWWEAAKETGVVRKAVNGGIIPMLVYNVEDSKFVIVGGKYEVKDVGIRN